MPSVSSNFFSPAHISSLPSFSCDTWHIPLDCLLSSLRARLNCRVGKNEQKVEISSARARGRGGPPQVGTLECWVD